MFYIYVLRSQLDGSEYVGMTEYPDDRLLSHNRGEVRSTKSKRPWSRVYLEEYQDRIAARAREIYLKTAAGRRFRRSFLAVGMSR